jgi:hypothetical protein
MREKRSAQNVEERNWNNSLPPSRLKPRERVNVLKNKFQMSKLKVQILEQRLRLRLRLKLGRLNSKPQPKP